MRTDNEKRAFIANLKLRIKKWVIRTIQFCESLPKSSTTRVINYQLLKSATSTGANHRAACRARSTNEFFAKICIAVEECDESLYWLELIQATISKHKEEELSWLLNENEELLKILVSSKSNAKKLK